MFQIPYPSSPRWCMTIGTVTRRVATWVKLERTPNTVFLPIEAARLMCDGGEFLAFDIILASNHTNLFTKYFIRLILHAARALHHRRMMEDRFFKELRPVQPIVAALEFGTQHICVVPIVHRKPWEKEFVVPTTGAAQYC